MRSLIDVKKASTNTDKSVVNGQENVGLGGVGRSKKHESADKHVAGEAIYVDDRPALRGSGRSIYSCAREYSFYGLICSKVC